MSQNVIVKTSPDYGLRNEREKFKRFQTLAPLRRFIDEIEDPPSLVLEHLDSDLLQESRTKKLESSDVKHVARVILRALAVFHEQGIVHGGARNSHGCNFRATNDIFLTDIKPENILVNYGPCGRRFTDVKLADCEYSIHMDSVVEGYFSGTPIFSSPEALLQLVWGPPTDIWSLGATVRTSLRRLDW